MAKSSYMPPIATDLLQHVDTQQDLYTPSGRERSDSGITIPETALPPPLRTAVGPTFASDLLHGAGPLRISSPSPPSPPLPFSARHWPPPLRPRRSTLEVDACYQPGAFSTAAYPPFGQPSPNPSDGDYMRDDDADYGRPFIPLLDGNSKLSSSPHHSPSNANGNTPPSAVGTAMAALKSPPAGTDGVSASRVTSRLTPLLFSDDHLLRCLRDGDSYSPAMTAVLEEACGPRRRADLDAALTFRDFAAYERERYVSTTLEVYDVAADATASKVSPDADGPCAAAAVTALARQPSAVGGDGWAWEDGDDFVDAPMVWDTVRDVNRDGESVGRITIVQEPTPLNLAALHLAMSPHFDMTELLDHLISDEPNRGRTRAFMHRAFERPPSPLASAHLRRRSFFFVFKYYTAVGEGLEPSPWQRFDRRPVHHHAHHHHHHNSSSRDHIDIAECSSVLALSLGGEPTARLRMRPRRERARDGCLFDTFGPWHLLSLQSFPDDLHTVRGDEFQRKSFYSGPYAFVELLIAEYRDAGKRNQVLHERITKLITPPTEFVFDRRLRDKLLFEDKHFTYIRRYFWAYNTLAVINTGIKAMVACHADTFTDDFWAGTHPLLWPHPAPGAGLRGNNKNNDGDDDGYDEDERAEAAAAYADKMAVLRRELDKAVAELAEVLKRNERTRKEIENLRDQLFSGSSIKESRRAIDQGDNIRILTMISMVFLPLTFVTSVFGITEFTIPATNWRFPLTMVLVCVPFMAVIVFLQTHYSAVLVRRLYDTISAWVARHRDPEVAETPRATAPAVATAGGRKRRRRRPVVVAEGASSFLPRWKGGWPWFRRGNISDESELGKV